jgi:hypothetical protein
VLAVAFCGLLAFLVGAKVRGQQGQQAAAAPSQATAPVFGRR